MPRYTISIIAFLISASTFSQPYIWYEGQNADSLLKVLPGQEKEDRVNTLNRLAYAIYLDDSVAGRQYAEEAMRLSEAMGYEAGLAEAYRHLGYFHYIQGDFVRTLQYYYRSLPLFEELNDRYKAGRLYEEIAATHYYSNNIEKTLEYVNIAMGIYKEKNGHGTMVGRASDTLRLSRRLVFVYSENSELGKDEEALGMYFSHSDILRKLDYDTADLLLNTWIIGVLYHQLGHNDSAMFYLNKALALPGSGPNVTNLKHKVLSWMGYVYYSERKYDSAFVNFSACIDYYSSNGFLFMATLNCNRLAQLYLNMQDLKNAEKYFRKAESLFTEMIDRNSWYRYDSLKHIVSYGEELYLPMPISRLKEMMWSQGRWLYKRLYELCLEENRTSDALRYLMLYGAAKDTMHVIDLQREAMELQTRYESERKDQQIINLAKEKEWSESRLILTRILLFSLTGFIILMIMMGIILIRQNKLKEQQKNMILQEKLFRFQMNPHFIFNSLSSIHHFMIDKEPVTAAAYLSKFSKLIRTILHSSVKEYTSLSSEIITIGNYLELQKLRFPEKFDFHIEVSEMIEAETVNIPSMIIQPFIENAIEHGIKHKESMGHIRVSFRPKDDKVEIIVEDDGIGRAKARELNKGQQKEHTSLATHIIGERIKVLNRTSKQKITLRINDLTNENGIASGTQVILEVPIGG